MATKKSNIKQVGLHLTQTEVKKAMKIAGVKRPSTAVTILFRRALESA